MGVCEYALTRARWADRRTACPKRPGGLPEQSSRDGLFNRGLGAEVQSVQLSLVGRRAYLPVSSATSGASVSAATAPKTK
jgi:hypothetical protein